MFYNLKKVWINLFKLYLHKKSAKKVFFVSNYPPPPLSLYLFFLYTNWKESYKLLHPGLKTRILSKEADLIHRFVTAILNFLSIKSRYITKLYESKVPTGYTETRNASTIHRFCRNPRKPVVPLNRWRGTVLNCKPVLSHPMIRRRTKVQKSRAHPTPLTRMNPRIIALCKRHKEMKKKNK